MNGFWEKVPFLKFLLALLVGIIWEYYREVNQYLSPLLAVAVALMLGSYLLPHFFRFRFRALFGIGLYLFWVSLGVFTTFHAKKQSVFEYPDMPQGYIGYVEEMPQKKPRSIACKLALQGYPSKKIVAYLYPDSLSESLQVGDKVLFYGRISPFKNMGNPDDFDYKSYMHRLGFSGSVYLTQDKWQKISRDKFNLYGCAQQARAKILQFFTDVGLEGEAFAVFAALTVGYVDALDDETRASFQATGTSHVLSVSGLHVGIIYMVIASMLFFLPKEDVRLKILKQVLIITALWLYAFVTGLAPAVVRASLMLTVFCVSVATGRRMFSYNAISFAAVIMLLYNPMNLFHIGFQLSFGAVYSMAFYMPVFKRFYGRARLPLVGKAKELFFIAIAVQLGTAPICLVYFGTFPVYFFISNMLIVPISTLIVYVAVVFLMFSLISSFIPIISGISDIFLWILNYALDILIACVRFFEHLPYALLTEIPLSASEAFVWIILIGLFVKFLETKRVKLFLYTCTCLFVLLLIPCFEIQAKEDDAVYIFNRRDYTEIGFASKKGNIVIAKDSSLHDILFLNPEGVGIAIPDTHTRTNKFTDSLFHVDCLLLRGQDSLSMYRLSKIFSTDMVVLDATLPARHMRRLARECEKLSLPFYDVREKGAYRIKND